MRITILFGAALTLAFGACDEGEDESKFKSDASKEVVERSELTREAAERRDVP